MIHQKPPLVKTTPHPQAAQVAARLNAGAHERCASCLNWIAKKHAGSIAVYMRRVGPHVGYALCRRCAKNVNGTPEQQRALTDRVEMYLDGGVQ